MKNILLVFISCDYTLPADDDRTLKDGKISGKIAGRYGRHRGLTGWHNLVGFNNAQPTDMTLNLIKVGQRETAALTRESRDLPTRPPKVDASSSLLKAKRP